MFTEKCDDVTKLSVMKQKNFLQNSISNPSLFETAETRNGTIFISNLKNVLKKQSSPLIAHSADYLMKQQLIGRRAKHEADVNNVVLTRSLYEIRIRIYQVLTFYKIEEAKKPKKLCLSVFSCWQWEGLPCLISWCIWNRRQPHWVKWWVRSPMIHKEMPI